MLKSKAVIRHTIGLPDAADMVHAALPQAKSHSCAPNQPTIAKGTLR